jgi:hypothetical protein
MQADWFYLSYDCGHRATWITPTEARAIMDDISLLWCPICMLDVNNDALYQVPSVFSGWHGSFGDGMIHILR